MAEKYNLIHERVDDIPLLIRLMQHGYSKDHRPDLPQNHPDTLLLLMCGHKADDPLYQPVRQIVGKSGLLVTVRWLLWRHV